MNELRVCSQFKTFTCNLRSGPFTNITAVFGERKTTAIQFLLPNNELQSERHI